MATKKDPNKYLRCMSCDSEKIKETNFYNTRNKLYEKIGKLPICKACIKSTVNYDDMESIYSILRQFDIMFDVTHWESAENSKTDTFATYMRKANSLPNFEGTGWKHSVFVKQEVIEESIRENTESENHKPISSPTAIFEITDDVIDKWGFGYLPEEYRAFENKYSMLKNNYQEKTAMHTEALLTYIRYRVKEELATAKNDMKAAKDWGVLAQKAAQDAKINPSQLSKSDLSDGLDTFGQLVRSVEQAVDIIPILPVFKERPQDKVDFTIFCYINYIRDLKGLPLAEYEDVYKFYEARKKEFEERDDQ